jgi:NADH:ubiquinone oxidoreductase subunit H
MALICFFNFNFFGFLSFFRSNILSIAFDVLFCFLAFFGLFYFFELWALALPLFFVILLEVGRTPFDLNEGESELVSGYNIEYSSIRFTILFLGEYLRLIFCVVLLGLLFSLPFFVVFFALFCLVQVRSVLPRLKFFGVYSLGFRFFGLLTFVLLLPLCARGHGLTI